MQVNLFLHVGQLHSCHACGGLRSPYLISAFHPVPYGDMNNEANVPHSCKTLLETVEHIGIGKSVTARKCHVREIDRTHKTCVLLADIDSILQHSYLGTTTESRVGCEAFAVNFCGCREFVAVLIGQRYFFIHRYSTQLAEQHLGQGKAIFNLRALHIGLIYLDVDL